MAVFDNLITSNIPRLRRYARALVHNLDVADDLVQDCLERAWSRRHLWDETLEIRPWLFTIMHNLYANTARQYHQTPAIVSINQLEEAAHPAQETDISLRDFERSLRMLNNEQREVLVLVGLEQMSYKETAEILNIPIGTVMSRLIRAREKLKQLMSNPPAPQIRRIK